MAENIQEYDPSAYTAITTHVAILHQPADVDQAAAILASERGQVEAMVRAQAWNGPMSVRYSSWGQEQIVAATDRVTGRLDALRTTVRDALDTGMNINLGAAHAAYMGIFMALGDRRVIEPAQRRAANLLVSATKHQERFFGQPKRRDLRSLTPMERRIESATYAGRGSRERREADRKQRRTELTELLYRLGVLGTGEPLAIVAEERVLPEGHPRTQTSYYDPANFRFLASRPVQKS